MARRAVKAQLPEVRFASVLKAFLCCLVIGGAAVGYVRQTHQNTALKEEKKELFNEIAKREAQNVRLQKELSDYRSMEMLETMARHLGSDLQPPLPGQVVELEMPGPAAPLVARSGSRGGPGEGGRE